MSGVKHDSQKPPMDLLPYDSLEEIAKVLGFGKDKYGAYNWKEGISYSRLIAAAMRHLGQFNNGVDLDEEAKTLHTANAACNLLFLIWMQKNRPDMDDRWKPNDKDQPKLIEYIDKIASIMIDNGQTPSSVLINPEKYIQLKQELNVKEYMLLTKIVTKCTPYGLDVIVDETEKVFSVY